MSNKKVKSVQDFKDYDFNSCDVPADCAGDYPNLNFFRKHFMPVVRRELSALAARLGAKATISGTGFTFSCDFTKGTKSVYLYAGDVRYEPNWYTHIMYRRVSSDPNDIRCGNMYCGYEELANRIGELLDS